MDGPMDGPMELDDIEDTIDLTGNTATIEASVVGGRTRQGYMGNLILFMLYLFDHSPDRLKEELVPKLVEAHAKDAVLPPKKAKLRVNLRAVAKESLSSMQRTTDGNTSPIILTGDNALTYKDIADFMNTKKRKVKVSKELIRERQRQRQDATANETTVAEGTVNQRTEVDVLVRCSDSTYEAIKSSISFLYTESNNKVPENIKAGLARYGKGGKRYGRQLKQDLGLKLTEGKHPICKKIYKKIAEFLFKSANPEYVFAHMFLILDW